MTLDIPAGDFAAYLFDCDGTLADTMPLHYRAWRATLDPLGCPMSEDLFYSLGGMPTDGVVDFLNERNGMHLPAMEVARRKEVAFLALIPEVEPVPEVMDFMLSKSGRYPLGIGTGGFRSVVTAILDALGVREKFGAIVTSEDVVHGKPAPDTWLQGAALLGIAPESCLGFEDTELGRKSVVAAGMQCVMVPSRRIG